ncbi:MAG: nuclease [Silvibacterium sp.]
MNFRTRTGALRTCVYTRGMNRNLSVCLRRAAVFTLLPLLAVPPSFGWGDTGHKMINRLGVESLPSDVPAFLRAPGAIDEIEYLGPEPDRWRSLGEPELNAAQAPDHFIDLEYADMIGPLPRRRYDYIAALTAAEITHPDIARELQPDKVGFQPYITSETWERLKSAMRNYRELTAQHADTKPVEAAILFYAGWMGHYVADGSQPLHVTRDYDGWVEKDNPNGYTTQHGIHSKFETTFVSANLTAADVRPLMTPVHPVSDEWDAYLAYLRHTGSLTERLYQLDKEHGFDGAGTPAGKQFTAERLAAGASMLRDLIYSAWIASAQPVPQWHGK